MNMRKLLETVELCNVGKKSWMDSKRKLILELVSKHITSL